MEVGRTRREVVQGRFPGAAQQRLPEHRTAMLGAIYGEWKHNTLKRQCLFELGAGSRDFLERMIHRLVPHGAAWYKPVHRLFALLEEHGDAALTEALTNCHHPRERAPCGTHRPVLAHRQPHRSGPEHRSTRSARCTLTEAGGTPASLPLAAERKRATNPAAAGTPAGRDTRGFVPLFHSIPTSAGISGSSRALFSVATARHVSRVACRDQGPRPATAIRDTRQANGDGARRYSDTSLERGGLEPPSQLPARSRRTQKRLRSSSPST